MTDSRNIPLVALLLAVVAAYPAQAQDGPFLDVTGRLGNETAPSFLNFAGPTEGEAPEVLLFQPMGGQKSPAAATLFSILVPGLGQMYAGDGRRGAGILGGTLAFPLVGLGLYHGMCEIGEAGCGLGAVLGVIHGIAGALVYGYGVIDAAPTAHRMNARRAGLSFQVAPTLGLPGPSGEGIGLVLRLSAPLPR